MAEIKIKDINIDGNDLFDDYEGFMDDLNEELLDGVNGGMLLPYEPIECPFPGPISPRPFPTGPLTIPSVIVIL